MARVEEKLGRYGIMNMARLLVLSLVMDFQGSPIKLSCAPKRDTHLKRPLGSKLHRDESN